MLGDVLLITEKHEKAAKAIFDKIIAEKKEKFIIAISGESGSGKTELAHVLAKLFKEKGIRAKPLHIDNYYKIHPLERTEWRIKNIIENVVGFGEYDWEEINKNIEDFGKGKKSTMPCIDIVTDQVDMLTSDFGNVDMLIIDGLYAIETDAANLRIFIELTYHETKKAQQKRGKEPQNEYRMRVLEQEHKVVKSLKSKADIFIDKNYQVRFKR
ncbi:MAG: uridine kinase [Bacteroidetes bacterium]|jgi:uridine kinase|nr:uridine kinase [Bacteroidota bacterium]MBT6685533.1 uridine kinase [Bacteroidota bacterium]MBT7144966.1 uridine kinase [Bacteroidota bacterium]MBT7492484.1 uridine kinase [Bacteroidota bacterium]